MILAYNNQTPQQQRLINQLTDLNHYLSTLNNPNPILDHHKKPGNNFIIQSSSYQDSLQKYRQFNQVNISDLNDLGLRDEEYDTLFNQPSNFLLTNNQHNQVKNNVRKQSNHQIPQSRQTKHNHPQTMRHHQHHNQKENQKYQQIMKEKEFVFKKQKVQGRRVMDKKGLPPHCKQGNGRKFGEKGKKGQKIERQIGNSLQIIKKHTKTQHVYQHQYSQQQDYQEFHVQQQPQFHQKPQQQKPQNIIGYKKVTTKQNFPVRDKCKTEYLAQVGKQKRVETIEEYLEAITFGNNQRRQKQSRRQGKSRGQNMQKSKSIKLINHKVKQQPNFIFSDTNSLECTFQPKILKKSQQILNNKQTNPKGFVQRLSTTPTPNHQFNQKIPYQPQHINKPTVTFQRLQKLSQPRQPKQPQAHQLQPLPSFRPSLSKKSIQHMSNCTYDVATRNKLWLIQKQQKIAKLKKQQQEQRLRKQQLISSTSLSYHQPSSKIYKGQNCQVHFSKFGKEGLVQYFQRLSLLKHKNKHKNSTVTSSHSTILLSKQSSSTVINPPLNKKADKQTTYCNNNNKENFNFNKQNNKKKINYEEAVKDLHLKIMKLKI